MPFVLSGTGDETAGAEEGVDAIAAGLPDLTADGSTPNVCTSVFAYVERICRSKLTKCDRMANAILPPLHEDKLVSAVLGKGGAKEEEADTTVGEDELEDLHLSSEGGLRVDTEMSSCDMPAEESLP